MLLRFNVSHVFVVAFLCSHLVCARRASAQQSAPSTATKPVQEQVTVLEFRDRLTSLARERHVAFMVEGEPFAGVLEKAAMPPARSPSDSTDKVVALFADAFDYESQRRGSVYILRKRYSNPNDMPIVTPEEWYATGSEWNKLIAAFRQANNYIPSFAYSSDIDAGTQAAMVAALTPEQLAECQQGHYVMMRDLAPDSILRQMVQRAVITECIGDNTALPETMNYTFMPGVLCFERSPSGKIGYTLPYPADGVTKRRFYPLFASPPPDTPQSGALARRLASYPEVAIPLRQAVATLNMSLAARPTVKSATAAKSTPSARYLAVEDAIAEKPVLLVGTDGVPESPMALAIDLAAVYGLDTRRTPEKPTVVRLIRQPLPARIDKLLDLWQITRVALCAPLRTALHLDIEDILEGIPTIYHPKTLEDYNFLEKQAKARKAVVEQRELFADAAERELLYYLEHHLKQIRTAASKEEASKPLDRGDLPESIFLNKLPPYYQTAYILYTMRQSIVNGNGYATDALYPPVQASHLDNIFFKVAPDNDADGRREMRLYFGLAPAENMRNADSGAFSSVGYYIDPPPPTAKHQ